MCAFGQLKLFRCPAGPAQRHRVQYMPRKVGAPPPIAAKRQIELAQAHADRKAVSCRNQGRVNGSFKTALCAHIASKLVQAAN